MITLLGQLTRGIGVADRADRGRPATRQRIWPSPSARRAFAWSRTASSSSSRVSTTPNSARTRSPRKLDVHRWRRWRGAGEQQVTVQANRCGGERGRRTEVGRWAASRDEYVGATFERTHQVLEGTRLVAGHSKPGEIVSLHVERPRLKGGLQAMHAVSGVGRRDRSSGIHTHSSARSRGRADPGRDRRPSHLVAHIPRRPGTTLLCGRGTRRHHGADHVVEVSATGARSSCMSCWAVCLPSLTQAGEDLLRGQVVPVTVQVAAHRVDLDAQAGQQVPRELQ